MSNVFIYFKQAWVSPRLHCIALENVASDDWRLKHWRRDILWYNPIMQPTEILIDLNNWNEIHPPTPTMRNGDLHIYPKADDVVLGVDGGATSTVCVCIPLLTRHLPDPLPILARAASGCSNYNSVGGHSFSPDSIILIRYIVWWNTLVKCSL